MQTVSFLCKQSSRAREVDHSPPFGAEDKNERRYTSTPPIRLHDVDRDSFTFYLLFVTGNAVKQHRQCTCNTTLRGVRATTVAVGKQQVLHIPSVCL